MQSSFPNKIEVLESIPIEWYDGIVTAIVKIQGRRTWFFVSLLTWDYDTKEKIFAVFPLDNNNDVIILKEILLENEKLKSDESWKVIQNKICELRNEYQGKVKVVKCINFGELVIDAMEIDIDKNGLRSLIGQDVEATFNEELIKSWSTILTS